MISRFILRESQQFEFKILSISALIALLLIFIVTALLKGLSSEFQNEAESLLGGRLVLESPTPLSQSLEQQAKEGGLQTARNIEFFSMLNANDQFLLAKVSAFSGQFPLVGQLLISNQVGQQQAFNQAPQAGQAWVVERILSELQLKIGDKIGVGNTELTIAGVLTKYPLLLSRSNFMAPTIYVNLADLDKMAVIKLGSRINYRLVVMGEDKQIEAFTSLESVRTEGVKMTTAQQGRQTIQRPFRIANRYLSVILVIQTLLSGLAIAVCSHLYARRQKLAVAMMRAFGATYGKILSLYLSVYAAFVSMITLAVFGIGYAIIQALFKVVPVLKTLTIQIPPLAYGLTFLMACFIVIGFSLPPILALRDDTVTQMKQNSSKATPTRFYWIYFLTICMIVLTLLSIFSEYRVPLRMMSLVTVVAVLIFGLGWLFFKSLEKMKPYAGYTLKMVMGGFLRLRWLGLTQWVVYGLIFTALMVIEIIQYDLLVQWQTGLPEETPNYFLINIQKDQEQSLQKWFNDNNILTASTYPIVRATFTHINDEPVSTWGEGRGQETAPTGLNRAINLSWMSAIPKDNTVMKGEEWSDNLREEHVVSIEERFAYRRGIDVGDTLTFLMGAEFVRAKVIQIRQVNWESFKPNFYVIFPPGVIDNLPASYISSFYLPKEKAYLINELTDRFLEASLIDIDAMLSMVRKLIRQFAFGLEFVLFIMLISGLLLMWIIMQVMLKERMHESALLKILGVPKGMIKKTLLIEYGTLGLLCGLIGAFFAQMIIHDVAFEFFDLSYQFSWIWFGIGAFFGALLLLGFALIGFRKVFLVPPLLILRQTA